MVDSLVTIVFWVSACVVVYVYAGYPLVLWLLGSLGFGRPVRRAAIEPPVTLVVSAYNEAAVIAEKVRNSLELDYPADRLHILVVSDASSDGTDAEVQSCQDPRVELLRMSDRGGKTAGLNAAVRRARGDIIVFSDANALYDKQALRQLVRNFADPEVGAVTGESRYRIAEDDASTDAENQYWTYELWIKRLESSLGSLVGADGAIYAVRKELYQDLGVADLSDFVNPLQVVARGYRNVYEAAAISYEGGAEGFAAEFRRKVRIVNRAWRATLKLRGLLNPFRHGFFALQFLSHKVLRWFIPVFLLAVLAANLWLASGSLFYSATLAAQVLLYAAAAIGMLLERLGHPVRLLNVPYYFCAVNVASLLGIGQALAGRTYTTWNSSRPVN
ncbi:MAG: glycosyltransferase family 2 protein [Gammaproteobacteria bacterium]|nr:glycosyltransferase family 2 protein [Gammaproteobacteria bacterium]